MAITTLEEVTEEHIARILEKADKDEFTADSLYDIMLNNNAVFQFMRKYVETSNDPQYTLAVLAEVYQVLKEAGPLPKVSADNLHILAEEIEERKPLEYVQGVLDQFKPEHPLTKYIRSKVVKSKDAQHLVQGIALVYKSLQS